MVYFLGCRMLKPLAIASAVNVTGEHTLYNKGFVMVAAPQFYTRLTVAKR